MVSMQLLQFQLQAYFGCNPLLGQKLKKSASNVAALKSFEMPAINKSSKCVPINFPSCITEKNKNENNRIFNLNSQSTQMKNN